MYAKHCFTAYFPFAQDYSLEPDFSFFSRNVQNLCKFSRFPNKATDLDLTLQSVESLAQTASRTGRLRVGLHKIIFFIPSKNKRFTHYPLTLENQLKFTG